VKKQPIGRQKYLLNRFRRGKVFYNIPDRRWWLNLSYMSPEAKATVYFTRYSQANSEEKRKLEKYLKTLPGFSSSRFARKLKELKKRGIR